MIHMLSVFNVEEGAEDFARAYAAFVKEVKDAGIVAGAGPLGRRVADTPMDTNAAWGQSLVSRMSFEDRAQLDRAYAFIAEKSEPGASAHARMYAQVRDEVFTCWEEPSDQA